MHICKAFIIAWVICHAQILGSEFTAQTNAQTLPHIIYNGVLELCDDTSMVSVVSSVIAPKRITKGKLCALLIGNNAMPNLIKAKDRDMPNFVGISHQNAPEHVTLYAELSRSKNDIDSQLGGEKNTYSAAFTLIAGQSQYKKSRAEWARAISGITAFFGTLGTLDYYQYSPVKTVVGAIVACLAIGNACYLLLRTWQIRSRYKKLQELRRLLIHFSPLTSLYNCFEQQEADEATRTSFYHALYRSLPPQHIHYHRVVTTTITHRFYPSGAKRQTNVIDRKYVPCLMLRSS